MKVFILIHATLLQGAREHWAVYDTSPPKLFGYIFLLVGLKTLGTFIEF